MKKENRKTLCIGVILLLLFVLWTAALGFIDVKPIGPQGSYVGFATLNKLVHGITGVHMSLYTVTDWLGVVPFCFITGFAIQGFVQLVKRKSVLRVDYSILALGVFYIVVMAVYAFFELFVVNYRPVLINGCLEASYPSSTTVLVMCVMPTAVMQFNDRIKNSLIRRITAVSIMNFTVFMVIARLVSGVHWFSDIAGGVLFSCGSVMIYAFIKNCRDNNKYNY